MRDLVTPIDIDLVISEEIQYIAGKLYTLEANNKTIQLQCTDFFNLQKVIKHGYNVPDKMKNRNCTEQRYVITIYIEDVVKQFCDHLKISEQIYEMLFLYTLLYPFDYNIKQKKFWKLLNFSDMEYLNQKFEDQIMEFYQIKEENVKLQAYLFTLTFTLLADNQTSGLLEKAQVHIRFIKHELKSKLADQILNALELSYDNNDWSKVSSNMYILYKGFQLESHSGGQKLQEVL